MLLCFFFFKQKTAYEMRISDWSSDVCSSDLRGMHLGRGGAADQQRQRKALALHLGGDIAHLVEARRDQAAEPDDVGLLLLRFLKNAGTGHHDAEVDHPVVVALDRKSTRLTSSH